MPPHKATASKPITSPATPPTPTTTPNPANEEAEAASVVITPEVSMIGIEVPMAHIRFPNGGGMYNQRRLDTALSPEESTALRDLYDGLVAQGVFKGNSTQGDAVRWMLRQLAIKSKK